MDIGCIRGVDRGLEGCGMTWLIYELILVCVCVQLAIAISSFPGRILGTEARPRKYNREYVINVTNEHARRREAVSGKVPRQWFKGRPRLTDQSWEKMWNAHLHWKRWTQERMGPYNSPI